MSKTSKSHWPWLDHVLRRRFLPDQQDLPASTQQLALEHVAVFPGAALVADGSPKATVVSAGESHAVVHTPPTPWAYAAHLVFAPSPIGGDADLIVRCDLWVQRGLLEAGLLDADGEFIVRSSCGPADGRTAINLRLPAGQQATELVIRTGGQGAAVATIEQVQIYRILTEPKTDHEPASNEPRVSKASRSMTQAFSLGRPAPRPAAAEPLVSLILTVKNGLPYLVEALESVRRLTYPNVELVVQDCLSDDGGSDLLARFDGCKVVYTRERDAGIGDANNRALGRCRGSIIGTIDSDNLLSPDGIRKAVEHFARRPGDAVVYGAVQMVGADGTPDSVFRPGPFDFLKIISCDQVLPWSTAFFNRAICGDNLHMAPELKTCADFDIWLRLSHLPIAYLDEVLGSTRLSDKSMSCNPEAYRQFCKDKLFSLQQYMQACAHEPLRQATVRYGAAGIYCWAAESVKRLAPERVDLITEYFEQARATAPDVARVTVAAQRLFG